MQPEPTMWLLRPNWAMAAICLTILLLSMGGFPLTAGFFGKFFKR